MELLGWDKSRLFLFFRCRLLCSCVGNQALSSLGSCHCCQFCSWCCGQICRSPGKSHMGRLLVKTLTMTACHHCTARVFSSTCLLALLVSKHLSAIWFVFFGWGWKRKWFGQEGGGCTDHWANLQQGTECSQPGHRQQRNFERHALGPRARCNYITADVWGCERARELRRGPLLVHGVWWPHG